MVKIGPSGEIIVPKEMLDYLGLKTNQTVIVSVVQDKLNIRKVFSYQEILDNTAKVKISKQAWQRMKDEQEKDF